MGYGPMATKLLERMGRISRGEYDFLNAHREEVHGFGQKPAKPEKKRASPKKENKLSKTATGKVQKVRLSLHFF